MESKLNSFPLYLLHKVRIQPRANKNTAAGTGVCSDGRKKRTSGNGRGRSRRRQQRTVEIRERRCAQADNTNTAENVDARRRPKTGIELTCSQTHEYGAHGRGHSRREPGSIQKSTAPMCAGEYSTHCERERVRVNKVKAEATR